MNGLFPVFKRQFNAYFASPVAYVTMALFLLLSGLSFYKALPTSAPEEVLPADLLFGQPFFWLVFLFAITMITMSLIAEEKTARTLEQMLTAPITDAAFVVGKFFAAYLFFMIMFLATLSFYFVANFFGVININPLHSNIIVPYAQIMMIAAFYITLGIFVSAISPNPTTSAMIGLSLATLIFFSGLLLETSVTGVLRYFIKAVSGVAHVSDFTRCIIDTRLILLYVSCTFFVLFSAIRTVEARHWK